MIVVIGVGVVVCGVVCGVVRIVDQSQSQGGHLTHVVVAIGVAVVGWWLHLTNPWHCFGVGD